MKHCLRQFACGCVVWLVTIPAICQRGNIGVDVGQVTDKFDSLAPTTDAMVDLNGQFTVIKPSEKRGGPSVVAGAELRSPTDTSYHAREYAVYAGLVFRYRDLSIGLDAQPRKIVLPPAIVNHQILNRDTMELLELPLIIKYRFGPGKHAFIEAQGEPEFTPRFHRTGPSLVTLPGPNLDHGYCLRGNIGYSFGKWYARGSYESRYFKFRPDAGNPNGLYNWRSRLISGGVGVQF
jgi:hypothetical protein